MKHEPDILHLVSLQRRDWPTRLVGKFPFNLEFLQRFDELTFVSQVTILVGENGSGKSTFLELIACSARLPTIGSVSAFKDPSLEHVQLLSKYFRLSWKRRTHRGFFLRAEDFFGFAKKIKNLELDLEQDLERVDNEYVGRSEYAVSLAKMAYHNELQGIRNAYGDGLDSRSHGESFLSVFQSRFVPNGLYLLDEPEAPLSPLRQLAFMSMVKDMVSQKSQFIIATHSPILMAYPGATILSFDGGQIRPEEFENLEHVVLTRSFLNNPDTYLNHLWDDLLPS
jgi:predicted ATPase